MNIIGVDGISDGIAVGAQGGIRNPSGAAALPTSGLIASFTAASVTGNTIPNAVNAGTVDPNMLVAPRRLFNNSVWWDAFSATVTDQNATAPDGSNDATTLVQATGTNDWGFQAKSTNEPTLVIGDTYTVAISVKWLGTGTGQFSINLSNSPNPSNETFTATTSWQRFTFTFVATATTHQINFTNPSNLTANFAICDCQQYAGSSDLNPNPLSAKPISVTRSDLVLSTNASVSAGAIAAGGVALMQLPTPLTLSAYTVMYVSKRVGTLSFLGYEPMLSTTGSGDIFIAGPQYNSTEGARVNGTFADINWPAAFADDVDSPVLNTATGSNDAGVMWGGSWGQTIVGVHRWDGTITASFLDGIKLRGGTGSGITAQTVENLYTGFTLDFVPANNAIYGVFIWDSALSDAQVAAAYAYAKSKTTLAPSLPTRFVLGAGTSIMGGIGGYAYYYQMAPELSPLAIGDDWGVFSSNLTNVWNTSATLVDGVTAAVKAQGMQMVILCDIGTNDINSATGLVPGFLAAFQTWCAARRSAGAKIVWCPIMSRGDAGTQPDFDTDRATVNNTIIDDWVGVFVDAVARYDQNSIMGANGAWSNATYFSGDDVHPSTAGYTLLTTYVVTSINALPFMTLYGTALASAGAVTLTGATQGVAVKTVLDIVSGTLVTSSYESTISVANEIQQTGTGTAGDAIQVVLA